MSRRTMLAGLAAGGVTVTGGCVRRVRSVVNRDPSAQLSLTITTVPADADRESMVIAEDLRENLEAVGIDARWETRSVEEFFRAVFLNQSFDLFVCRHPGHDDPDSLYESLHSVFAEEAGWQNPYGLTNMDVDDLLERQRRLEGDERREAVADLLREIATEQPFVPLCVPSETRLVRTDRFDGWDDADLSSPHGYLGATPREGDTPDDAATNLRAIITDARATVNLNPLSAEYRNRGLYVEFLYDSLAMTDGDEIRPLLADAWEWDDGTATVTLRPDLTFHDGEVLTAADVEFTYRFLRDTSLGSGSVRSPTPRYRGAVSAVESVEVLDDRTLSISVSTGQEVGERAFTVPILPKHVWENRTDEADVPGISVAQGTTDAVVTDNVPPVGSGPFQFVARTERETLDLERFDDHVSLRDPDLPEPTFDRLSTHVEPRSTAAIESIESGDADVTLTTLESYTIDDVTESEHVRLHTTPSRAYYLVGFDTRNAPFSNPYVRRTVAGLLDEASLVEDVFEGHARPTATPLTDAEWVPDDLAWDDGDDDPVVPFFGSDGDLDVDAARDAFEQIGYRYDDRGTLLSRT